jgi:hypothetical protein
VNPSITVVIILSSSMPGARGRDRGLIHEMRHKICTVSLVLQPFRVWRMYSILYLDSKVGSTTTHIPTNRLISSSSSLPSAEQSAMLSAEQSAMLSAEQSTSSSAQPNKIRKGGRQDGPEKKRRKTNGK